LALVVTVPSVTGCGGVDSDSTGSASGVPTAPAPELHVAGNRIVDQTGAEVRLLGVNRSGGEFECVHGGTIWDGPVDDASVAAIASWHARTVRVALNEDCWLGMDPVVQASSGAMYRQAVADYVQTLRAHGIVPILDLHWTSGRWTGNASQCGEARSTCQKPMPDADRAPAFWASVAERFRDDRSVVFDLFNEPFPNATGGMSADESWDCWLHGGQACPGLTYPAAGMQQLVDAVRGTGARNVILVSGNAYADDLTKWLAHRPNDPTGNLGAAWHSYSYGSCRDAACWNAQVAPVAAVVPVVALEIGETDCQGDYVEPLMNWLDGHGIGYLGWTWNTWDCGTGPALISKYDGTATKYGATVRAHLRAH
jgi:hypothetical protein